MRELRKIEELLAVTALMATMLSVGSIFLLAGLFSVDIFNCNPTILVTVFFVLTLIIWMVLFLNNLNENLQHTVKEI